MVKMMTSISKQVSICCVLALVPFACAGAGEENMRSYHLGLLYPNGADIAGYTVEDKIKGNIYRFYTFGFPAIASIGVTYYENYEGNGLATSVGVGLGFLSMIHGSIAYQWKIEEADYVKLGVGLATTLVYNGAFPVLSYEHRFH
jgi:hypothetical protein